MPLPTRAPLAALALAALSAAPLAAQASAAQCDIPASIATFRSGLLSAMNEKRQEAGLKPLAPAPKLQQIAQEQACDDAVKGIYSHIGLDGSTFDQRLERVGYPTAGSRENTGMGAPAEDSDNIKAIVGFWMISNYHRHNMLDPDVSQVGIGKAHGSNGNDFWVVDFGRP